MTFLGLGLSRQAICSQTANLIGELRLNEGSVVEVAGAFAYIGITPFPSTTSTLQIVDVSNPTAPRLRNRFSVEGTIYQIKFYANFLYVFSRLQAGGSFVDIFQADQLENPTPVGRIITSENFGDGKFQGDKLYLPCRTGLNVYDISRPDQPALFSAFAHPDAILVIPFSDRYLFLASSGNQPDRNIILDAVDPHNLVKIAQFTTYQPVFDGFASGTELVLAMYAYGITVDVLNPSQPIVLNGYTGLNEMIIIGSGTINNHSHLFASRYTITFAIFDLAVSRTLPVASYNPPGIPVIRTSPSQVAVQNELVYAIYPYRGLSVLRIQESAPVQILYPAAGETFAGGTMVSIAWNADIASAGTAVRFELYRNSQFIGYLGSGWSPSGRGTTQILLPLVPEAQDYRIRAVSTWNPSLSAETFGNFTISGGPVRVTEPNDASVTWIQGEPALVSWRSNPEFSGTAVALELWDEDSMVMGLGNFWDQDGNGSNLIMVPHVPSGNNYRVRAVSLWDRQYYDLSDSPFVIGDIGAVESPVRTSVEMDRWMLYR